MAVDTFNNDLRLEANRANPNTLPSVFQQILIGNMLTPWKAVAAGLTAAASFDVTTAAFKALATITGGTLKTGENLPPIGMVRSLRVVTSGTANSVGSYVISDASGTATSPTASSVAGIALLSDDGKTLTFPTTVTAFTLYYLAAPAVALTTSYPTT